MKGVIFLCLSSLVKEKFGEDKWEQIMTQSGLNPKMHVLSTQDIDDTTVLNVVGNLCKVLNITLPQAADAFGDYWVNEYAPKIYASFMRRATNAKEMLLAMDNVHETVTKSVPNARPPRFDYIWENDNTLVMVYKSHRGLIDFLVGLVKGVGRYYNENLQVMKIADDRVKIYFE